VEPLADLGHATREAIAAEAQPVAAHRGCTTAAIELAAA